MFCIDLCKFYVLYVSLCRVQVCFNKLLYELYDLLHVVYGCV